MIVFEYIGHFLIFFGCLFCLVAAIGIFRFDKTLYQIHASSKGLTLGALFIIVGAFVLEPEWINRFKLILVAFFFFVTNPLSAFAIGRAWHRGLIKHLGERIENE